MTFKLISLNFEYFKIYFYSNSNLNPFIFRNWTAFWMEFLILNSEWCTTLLAITCVACFKLFIILLWHTWIWVQWLVAQRQMKCMHAGVFSDVRCVVWGPCMCWGQLSSYHMSSHTTALHRQKTCSCLPSRRVSHSWAQSYTLSALKILHLNKLVTLSSKVQCVHRPGVCQRGGDFAL